MKEINSQDVTIGESLVDTGSESSIEITLSSTAGNLTIVTLPTTAKGFKLYPRSSSIRFAVYQSDAARTLAAVATATGSTVAIGAFAIGAIAKNDVWEVRLLPPVLLGKDRTLSLRSTAGSVVVDLETF